MKTSPKSQPGSARASEHGTVTSDDLARLIGALDERKTLDILDLKPTLAEVEEAAIWATGDGDVLAKVGHPLGGVVAEIVDILTADEDEPPQIH